MAGVVPYPTVTGAETAHGAQTSAGGNPWLPYFGPSSGPLMTNAYDKYAEQNYDLPEAYKGRNLYLRDTINGLITGEGRNDFYTVALLPWAQTDQITFSWNEFHFNETLAGRVPHEGVSRLVTSSKRTKSDKAVRRGLAMVLEHGFMSTEEGQEMYRRNLIGIAQSIQETANHDVMAAIFSCDSYDQRWERDHGIVTDGLRRLMHEEVYRFAAVQKEANGLDILVEDAKKRMGRYGVAPDTLVIPPKLSIYMSLVRPEKSQYYIGGPPAMENVKRGGAISDFRNLSVYETRSFDVYKGEPPVDISLRRRQVGEYYTVGPNAGIVVYDEAMDNWRRLGHHELVNNCGRWFGADTPKDPKILAVYRKLMQSFEDSGYEQSVDVRIDDLKTADWAQIRASKWKHNNRSRGPPDTQWTKATGEEFYSFVRSSGSIAGLGVDSAVRDQIHDRVSALVSTGDNSVSLHDISADCKQLFDLERQSAEFKSVFAGMGTAAAGDGTNRAIVANEDGYTGHAAMHQSYRGVQLIAQYGDAAQVTAARRVLRSVDHVHKLLTVGQDMAAWVPANYLHTCDGLSMAALTSEHVAKTWVFAELSQCGFGHSLVPVTVDGRVDSAFANMEGGADQRRSGSRGQPHAGFGGRRDGRPVGPGLRQRRRVLRRHARDRHSHRRAARRRDAPPGRPLGRQRGRRPPEQARAAGRRGGVQLAARHAHLVRRAPRVGPAAAAAAAAAGAAARGAAPRPARQHGAHQPPCDRHRQETLGGRDHAQRQRDHAVDQLEG
jgi:hypothetical protein